jgi:heptosyltransferase-2
LIDEIYFSEDELEHLYNDMFDIAINLDSGKESCAIMSSIGAHEHFGYTLANGKPYPLNYLANEWYLMGVDDNTKKSNIKTYHQIIHEICGLEYTGTKPVLSLTSLHRKNAEILKNKYNLHNYQELILVNLGGGSRWQYKKWTKEGYVSLVNMLSESSESRAVGIIAGDEDRDFYNEISEEIEDRNNVIYFGCDNSIDDFICIIMLADKIFTADSLALHIATALDKYTIVVTGPTSYTELDIFGKGKIIYSSKVDCLCCYLARCSKTVTCMNTLSAEEVIQYLI